MTSKRSKHELKRIVEDAVAIVCHLPRPGLWFAVDEIEVRGRPPERLCIWYTLHFLRQGSPFCCGEPGCHVPLFGTRLAAIGDLVRSSMNLRQGVHVEIAGANVNYDEDAVFRILQEAQMRGLSWRASSAREPKADRTRAGRS